MDLNKINLSLEAQGDNRLIKAHSSDSLEMPWDKIRSRPPLIVAQSQTGRQISPDSFFMCFLAFLQLQAGLGLLGVNIWTMIRKYPYTIMISFVIDNTYFSIPGACLCFFGFWIAVSTMNQRSSQFLSLLIVFICLSTILLVTSSYVGFLFKSKLEPKNETLLSEIKKTEFISSMGQSLVQYDKIKIHKFAWDVTQKRLECCGIFNASDWIILREKIPDSCCQMGNCTESNSYKNNCVPFVAHEIYWYKLFISSLNVMVVAIHILSLIIIGLVYYWRRS
ncbi:unnamed protein product [Brassicogethes aeneus]|uniref:Tetraspanin n=1 Tax=Brassicogethes aeneus TaxID=1431903 RepID=A0A9P0BD07_BRAAE|nr:unnamed protein product [Brassicogethes aeneus]